MLLEREYPVPADTAYWTILEEVVPSFAPTVRQTYRGVPNPMPGHVELVRLDENPAMAHHLELQCYLASVGVRAKVGGCMHVYFADSPSGHEVSSTATIDVPDDDYGGEFLRLIVRAIPEWYWKAVRWMNGALRLEYRVDDHRVPWDPRWRTREQFVVGMGSGVLRATATLMLDQLGSALSVYGDSTAPP
jgi:hypothetical protein